MGIWQRIRHAKHLVLRKTSRLHGSPDRAKTGLSEGGIAKATLTEEKQFAAGQVERGGAGILCKTRYLRFGVVPVLIAAAFGAAHVSAQFSEELPPVEVTLNVGDTVLTVEGQTAPGAFVTILENSNPIGTTTADTSGQFSKSFTAQTPGLHTIGVFAKVNGQTTDTVTKNINLVAQAETTVDYFLPSTLTLSDTSLTQGQDITFQGHTIPGGTVTITVDNNLTINTTAGSDGKWSHTLSTEGFSIGAHNVYVVVSDQFGNQSAPTTKQAFQVLAAEPEAPPGEAPDFIEPPSITSPNDNQHFSQSPVTIEGIAPANSQIEIWDGDTIVGSVFANHLGKWQFVFDLTKPQHTIKVRACIQDVCSAFSDTVTIFYNKAEGVSSFFMRLDNYRYPNVYVGRPIDLTLFYGGGEAPYELVVDWGDETTERLTVEDSGSLSMSHAYENPGQYTGIVAMQDTDDASRTVYFSVLVTDTPPPLLSLINILVVVALITAWLLTVWVGRRIRLRFLAQTRHK